MNYGRHHPLETVGILEKDFRFTWQPVLYGEVPKDWKWEWSAENPVHFICHSQGGTTVRYLLEIMNGTHQEEFPPPDFPAEDCQHWVKSVFTLGTPHKGSTVTDVARVGDDLCMLDCLLQHLITSYLGAVSL